MRREDEMSNVCGRDKSNEAVGGLSSKEYLRIKASISILIHPCTQSAAARFFTACIYWKQNSEPSKELFSFLLWCLTDVWACNTVYRCVVRITKGAVMFQDKVIWFCNHVSQAFTLSLFRDISHRWRFSRTWLTRAAIFHNTRLVKQSKSQHILWNSHNNRVLFTIMIVSWFSDSEGLGYIYYDIYT